MYGQVSEKIFIMAKASKIEREEGLGLGSGNINQIWTDSKKKLLKHHFKRLYVLTGLVT